MAWIRTHRAADEVAYQRGGWGWVLFLLAVVLIAVLIFSGAMYFRQTPSTTEIIIDRDRIEAGAEQAAEQGRRALREAGEDLQRLGEKDADRPTTTPSEAR
jgi:hypothetical protein